MLLILLYVTLFLEFFYLNFILVCFLVLFFNPVDMFNILLYINLILKYKHYKYFNIFTLLSHIMFLIFIVNIEYNYQCFFNNIDNMFNLNAIINVSEIFQKIDIFKVILSNFNILTIDLYNYTYNTNYNNFFFKTNIFINNIIVGSDTYIYYNVDNALYLMLYKFYILFYILFTTLLFF